MVSGMPTLNPASYGSYVGGGNKVYVQVKPNQVVYSQFEHVSGYSFSAQGDRFVPVSKIKILNTLIDQLVKMQANKTKPDLPTDMTDAQVDAMIKDYQQQVKAAINSAKESPFGLSGATGLPSALVMSVSG
ncbi:MAG: hypothetical protein ACTTHG_03205 [Treponemataceae bacterium]